MLAAPSAYIETDFYICEWYVSTLREYSEHPTRVRQVIDIFDDEMRSVGRSSKLLRIAKARP